MKITKTRFNKFIDDSNIIFRNFDTKYSLHRTYKINQNKVLGLSMETGRPLSYLKGDTHIWIRDLTRPERDQCTDIFRGNNYDDLLKIDLVSMTGVD